MTGPAPHHALSRRALESLTLGKAADYFFKAAALPQYDPESRPSGLINLSGAVNRLMEDWNESFAESVSDKLELSKVTSYGALFGSPELRTAVASVYNTFFHPASSVSPAHVLAMNGVTSATELIAWALCDPGDVILCPVPTFFMLDFNVAVRNSISVVPVPVGHLGDPYAPENANLFAQAISTAMDSVAGRCRAVFLCNPQNPEGRFYSRETLRTLGLMCAKRSVHLVADEIYGLSQFGDEPFVSVLGATQTESEPYVHSMWGMSKDFGMGGLRMGYLVSRNEQLLKVIQRLTWFTWPSAFSDAFATLWLSQLDRLKEYVSTYQVRLRHAYGSAREALISENIPFQRAEAGLFIFIDLSQWLHHFWESSGSSPSAESPELQLWQWLVDEGVALEAGEVQLPAPVKAFRSQTNGFHKAFRIPKGRHVPLSFQ